MKKTLVVLFFATLVIPISVNADLLCGVKTSCLAGETDVFHMSSLENAHAELSTSSSYQYRVCCGGAKGGMTTTCGGSQSRGNSEILLRLSEASNAHAEKSTLSNYQNQVCLNANEGQINCDYVNSPSACTVLGSHYKCLATMSDETNAHVSDCDGSNDYNIKLCCEYKDITPPVTNISPSGSSWTGQDIPFSLSCSDFGGLCQSTYYKIINESESCGISGFSSGTSGTVSCAAGSVCTKKVCYYSNDDSGNQEQPAKISNVFRIDKKPPVTTDNSDDYWHGNDVQITLACQDPESGCSSTYYCVYNEGETPCNPSIQGNSINIFCQQGTCKKIIRYYSKDNSNNQESSRISKTIKIDTSLPTCTMTALSEYTNSSSIRLSWSASSQGAPITNVTIEKMETGAWEIVQTFMTPNGNYDFVGQNSRTYYFRCLAKNTRGEGSYSAEIKTTVDTGQPSAGITAASTVNTTTFSVGWSGEDPETGVVNYTLYYMVGSGSLFLWKVFEPPTISAIFGQDGQPLALQNNNTYKLKVKVMDRAGNTKESNEVSVLIDTAKPTCAIQDMPSFQTSNDFTVRWSGADGESGVKEFMVEQRVGSSWIQFHRGAETSKDIFSAQDGIYRFRCKSVDKANNIGDLSAEKNTTVDINPPEAQINFSSSVYVNDSLLINAKVTDAIRVNSVNLYYNNTILTETNVARNPNQSVWDVTWTISDLVTTGMKTFTISVQDVNGNSQNYSNQFLVAYCTPGDIQTGCKCGTGTKTCRSDGTWSECTGVTRQPRPEVCNGEDDDCNGIVDDLNGGSSVIGTNCQCFGSSLLSAQSETCDGIDNDCDGQIDENGNCCNEGDIQPCGTDIGICSNKKKTCAGGTWGPCTWEQGPTSEICGNSLDDNCNGEVDENCAACTDRDGDGYGDPASNMCTYSKQDCNDNDPTVYPGAPPTCDGKDNNCDGSTADEEAKCATCSNGIQDASEEGTDCGGDCPPCFVWGWLFLTAGGVVILLILAFVWFHFRRQGRELTWKELKKKWTPSE